MRTLHILLLAGMLGLWLWAIKERNEKIRKIVTGSEERK